MLRAPVLVSARAPRRIALALLAGGLGLVALLLVSGRSDAQTYDCRSPDPKAWPPSSKPYFMVALDTSGSMDSTVAGAAPSCAGYPTTRVGHARCALANMVKAYAGEVNFGLATFPMELQPRGSAAGTCGDGIKNGTGGAAETDVDCGGSTCRKCITGKVCAVNGDCVSNSCSAGKVCNPITCPANFLNGGGGGNVTGINCAVNQLWTGTNTSSCGNSTSGGAGATTTAQRGADILVPLPADDYWNTPSTSTPNAAALLAYVDNECGDCKELFSGGYTPLNGVMRDMQRYLTTSWSAPNGAAWNATPAGPPTYTTPLTGTERTCRSVNIILLTDGGETCPTDNNAAQASAAATALRTTGWTIGGTTWTAKTYVIDVGGATPATGSANIATAGGTTAIAAVNEVALSQALASVIGASIKAETCDNVDNNCNGCVDEGSKLYCNRNKTARTLTYLNTVANTKTVADCCSWTTAPERAACTAAFTGSISAANPKGSPWFLPCWDPTAAGGMTSPETKWLCSDPGETCDNLDNNCDQQVLTTATAPAPLFSTNVADEGQNKCTNQLGVLHCPVPEVCPAVGAPNGDDDNCDGVVDNALGSGVPGSICPGSCVPSPEICNGCDDDCDGVADNGIADLVCGFSPPANCAGVRTCAPVAVAVRGTCIAGVTKPGVSQFTACSSNPGTTDVTCDNLDDNCNGVIDEGAPATPCTNGQPGLVYKDVNPLSTCVKGQQACHTTTCVGWIGPSVEVCDGLDNDCDGLVDAADPDLTGVGAVCGSVQGLCTKGTTACIGGVVVCSGGTQPQPEICDGKDNNCNGQTDEAPLTDGPAAGANGCWQGTTGSCTFANLSWNAPTGGTCTGVGTLTAPCQAGALVCLGTQKWACQGGVLPTAEVCDGVDNDCSGTADNGNPGSGVACAPPGTVLGSACQGTSQCVSGKITCSGGATPTAEICNGSDDDCDGLVDGNDPDLVGVGTTCGSGLGTCKTGILACVSGAPVCQGEIKPSPEVCDGLDNNCNGAIDDAPTDTPASLGCWNLPGATCSGGGKTWSPPPNGTCTGLGTLTAPCGAGTLVCAGLNKWQCQGGTLPAPEACDGIDNDCNGTADNGNPGGGAACGTAPSILPCKKGSLTCVSGQLICQGEIGPSTELCDGVDNDCDGTIDDGNPGGGATCGSSTGICKKGTTTCVTSAGPPPSGTIQCTGGVNAQAVEVCNGLDDDCNGLVDDNLSDAPANLGCWNNTQTGCSWKNATWGKPQGANCSDVGTLTSPCKTGTLICAGATGWSCQGGQAPAPESCDGIDNDCKNGVDDGNPGGGAPCGPTLGVCAPGGTIQCIAGKPVCQGQATPGPELCNGLDDNCNGIPDNLDPNLVGVGQICGKNVGACHSGVQACVINVGPPLTAAIVCQGNYDGAPETCNGIDDDCNGIVDDAPVDAPADPGCWTLPGTTCTDSTGLKWDHPPGATCTGLGTAAGALTSPCSAGAMICKKGAWECVGARVPSGAEICDGVDNDCNGQVDEGNPGGGAVCGDPANPGTAPCKKGTLTCSGGTISCIGEVKPSAEICDNVDNDCKGGVDDGPLPGTGVACTDKCGAGTRICVAGNLVCKTTRTSQPEICNGIDDDCDGLVDNGVLGDAPAAGQDGCWNVNLVTNAGSASGAACSFSSGTTPPVITTWDKPAGASCTDLGGLKIPCQTGRLSCAGAKGWTCIGGKLPTTETCDGRDQDCDGTPDNGDPGAGAACQVGVGTEPQCSGTVHCTNGALSCNVKANPETCNGKDDDCDGVKDNGLPIGKACPATYDTSKYPGERTQGQCRPGTLICDPTGSGLYICNGGVGPQPEVCDGLDNDCDGSVDEAGAAPDGVSGSVNPANSKQTLGDLCGSKVGECKQGNLGCVGGQVICVGGKGPQPEFCDCLDNNCDGHVDESPAAGSADKPLCAGDSVCVKDGNNCECASGCKGNEFPCPTGAECKRLPLSSDPTATARYCVSNACGDCTTQTVKGECGPAGTVDDHGAALPLCQCSANTCQGPCRTTACGSLTCVPSGDFVGQCRPNGDCRFFGCPSGKACNAGACVDSPCTKDSCPADKVCKPSATFDHSRCVGSCADVTCGATEHCVDGLCEPTGCTSACGAGELCITTGTDAGGACGPSKCATNNGDPACSDGSHCDPPTGSCGGNDPCSGVLCPNGQVCLLGECAHPAEPTGSGGASNGGAGGASGAGTGASAGNDAGNVTSGGGTGGAESAGGGTGKAGNAGTGTTPQSSKEAIGLATGGGGCRCDLPTRSSSSREALGLGALLLSVFVTRRRARKEGGAR